MKHLRNKRGLAGLGALAAVIGATLWVVLPALASTPNDGVPPYSADGVMPVDVQTGGQPADKTCHAFGSTAAYSYQIKNPTPGSYTTSVPGGTKVTFNLFASTDTTLPAYASDTYFDFTSSGATVVDVGVNGGQDTTDYKYNSSSTVSFPILSADGTTTTTGSYQNSGPGFVTWDKNLHAPAQSILAGDKQGNPSQLYSLSHVTFCFNLGGPSLSGKVTANRSSTWPVYLIDQSGNVAKKISVSTTPDSAGTTYSGTYSFTYPSVQPGYDANGKPVDYTICEGAPSTGSWTQKPLSSPSSEATVVDCSTSGYLGSGYKIQPNGTTANLDFTNVANATVSGKAYLVDANGDTTNGISGLQVTLTDTTTGATSSTTTQTDGSYPDTNNPLAIPVGDSYTLCIKPTTFASTQTVPNTSDGCYSGSITGDLTDQNFGFTALGTISGNVYNDVNGDGSYQPPPTPPASSASDKPLGEWTVDLWAGTPGSSSSPLRTTTTNSDGLYTFDKVPADGTTYTVCEVLKTSVPPLPTGADTWVESQPDSTTSCGGAYAANGWAATPLLDLSTGNGLSVTGDNFGNVAGYTCPSAQTDPLGPSAYQVGTCKAGETYLFSTGQLPSGSGLPEGTPYVAYGFSGTGSLVQPTIEHLTVPDPYVTDTNGTQQPEYKSVWYSPSATPFPLDPSGVSWIEMPYCNFDPREPSGSTGGPYEPSTGPYALASPYGASSPVSLSTLSPYDGGLVLGSTGTASTSDVIPGTSDTACVISVTTSAPTSVGGTGTLDAWVYALDDATRAFR